MQPNPVRNSEAAGSTSECTTHAEQRQALHAAIAAWSHAVVTGDAFAQLVSAADAGARETDVALALDWDQTALDAAARVRADALDALDRLRLLEIEDVVRTRASDRRTRYGDAVTTEHHLTAVDHQSSALTVVQIRDATAPDGQAERSTRADAPSSSDSRQPSTPVSNSYRTRPNPPRDRRGRAPRLHHDRP